MKAEIIAVGTELLLGDILNTNAQFLSKQLAEMGFTVYHQSVIGDNSERLYELVKQAQTRSELIVFSGGLGPTDDDLTKQTVARAFDDELVFDKTEMDKISAYLTSTNKPVTKNNEKQAYIPKNGGKFENEKGTAPGVYFEKDGCTAVLLPGPPSELQPLFLNKVKPFLAKYQNGALHSVSLRIFGIGESELEGRVMRFLNRANPTSALYAKQGEVLLRVTAYAETEQKALEMCMPTVDEIKQELGSLIYGYDDDCLEGVAVKLLKENGLKLATAESCTGGMLSQRITSQSGASEVFDCGVCSYANEIKHKILGVKNETLAEFGAVSPQVAAQMAQGVALLANADMGIGITGIAGPGGGTPQKPVGLIYVGAYFKGKIYVKKLNVGGRGRHHARHMACQNALDMIRRLCLGIEINNAKEYTI